MTATWVLLLGVPVDDILLSFGYSPCARPFWRQSALRQHGVIDSFLCDDPPAANYRDAELQDVFNVHLTSFNYLAELTHKKGDFFSSSQYSCCTHTRRSDRNKGAYGQECSEA